MIEATRGHLATDVQAEVRSGFRLDELLALADTRGVRAWLKQAWRTRR